jgi:hypothetical protein
MDRALHESDGGSRSTVRGDAEHANSGRSVGIGFWPHAIGFGVALCSANSRQD